MVPQALNKDGVHVGKRPAAVDPVDVLVFLVPCLQFVRIHIIGVLNGSDITLLVAFFYFAFRGRLRIAKPVGKWALALCSLWLASQCVTDIVRHSAFADYARGWSNIGLALVNLALLWTLLYGRPRRLVIFGWGLVVGGVLLYLISPPEILSGGTPGLAWKFGFAFIVSLGVFLLASRKECRGHWPITLAVMVGMINMALGSRAVGGVCFAAALFLFVTGVSRRKNPGISRLKTGTMAALAASIIVSAAAVLGAYQYAAKAGILGEQASEKYEEQSSGDYGILLGGRTEILAEFPAIYDSPILGHGSWAREPLYIILQNQALARLGYKMAWDIDSDILQEGFIPTHSYIFGAWVDGGILGTVFWGWIFVMTARVLIRVYPATVELLPVASFLTFLLLWNILFSPFGTDARLTFPYTFVMLMTVMDPASWKVVQVQPAQARRMPQSKPKRIA